MRIGSDTIFRQAVAAMQQAQSDLARGQEQLSSGQRIQRAGEDPSAFSSAARMAAREAQLESFTRSGERATQRLSLAETRIAETRDVLDRVREIAVQGNSPALSVTDRQALDTELAQIREQLIQSMNATDGNGRALFAGTADGAAFTVAGDGSLRYAGDAGARRIAISENASVIDGDPGSRIFGSDGSNVVDAVDGLRAALAEPDAGLRANAIGGSLEALDVRLDELSLARGRIGARLSAIEQSADVSASERDQLTTARSRLMDTDIAKAVTEVAQAGNRLTAAQQSYLQVQRGSLFDLIR